MAIHLFCPVCKSSCTPSVTSCPNCGNRFGRTGRKYRVTVSVNRKRATRVFDNLTLAREGEAALKGDLVRGELDIKQKKPAPTLGEVWARYLPWAKENKKSWRDDFYIYRSRIQPKFEKKRLDEISPIDIERLKIELKKEQSARGKPLSKATIKHVLVVIRRLYSMAARWGMFRGDSPMKQVDMPRLDNQVTEFLEDEEVKRLLTVLDNWPFRQPAAFVKFALLTGFRRGELFRLLWADVDLRRGTVTLRDPKGGKTETVPISREAKKVLENLERENSPYVFPGRHGGRLTDIKTPWNRIKKAAGLPDDFRFHGLRHNFASHLVSNGTDLFVVGKLLSHKSPETTKRYAHLRDERLRQAVDLSDALLTQNGKKPELKAVEP